ncbi:PH domain-containing protein [Streptomyces mayteni]
MTNQPHFPVYRAAPGLKALGLPVAIPVMALGLMAVAGVPGVVLLSWTVVVLVLVPLLYVALRRSGTTTHPDHIETRTPFGTRRIAWRDIQSIEVTGSGTTGEFVLVRDGSGRRRGLPHVNSRTLGAALPGEVRRLHDLWAWLRGPDWTPPPPR